MTRRTFSVLAFSSSVAAATLAAVVMAGSALAETPTIDNTPFASTKTRAEVQAELFSHRDQISSTPVNGSCSRTRRKIPAATPASRPGPNISYSREQVRDANSEDGGSRSLAQMSAQTSARSL